MRKTGNSFKESNVEKGMVLPFNPLTMTFNDVHYFVDCPPVSDALPAHQMYAHCCKQMHFESLCMRQQMQSFCCHIACYNTSLLD